MTDATPEPRFRFRVPARTETLGAWLARLFPTVERATRRRWIAEGRVAVEGRLQDRGDRAVTPGAHVTVFGEDEEGPACASGAAAADGTWVAWVEETVWESGDLAGVGKNGDTARFVREACIAGYARLRLFEVGAAPERVLDALAGIGLPVVGDLERGGLGVVDGPRLGPATAPPSRPDEPVWRFDFDAGAAGDGNGRLRVSDETARVIERGHPWVRPDAASASIHGYRPGALVRLVDRHDAPVAWARVEGEGRIAARVWARTGERPRDLDSVEARIARALARRRDLLGADPSAFGNAHRLVHGEADDLPGLIVDRLGGLLRVLVTGTAAEGHRERALGALRHQLPISPEGHPWSVLELLHLRGPAGRAVDRVRWVEGGPERLRAVHPEVDAAGFVVRERGLDFWIDPGWDAPRRPRPGYGLFLDQRENRARVAARAAHGGRWLNLFAHTGAFSAALLAAGAERVTSVDLSPVYLERLEANLARNRARGVDPDRHETLRGEARRAIAAIDPAVRFRGIVIDPPTAAAAGRHFWSVREDLEPLLAIALARLEPGGHLLVTQNRAGPPLGLDRMLERLARRAHVRIDRLEPAPPGEDHPSLATFPEGDPFEGWLLDLR